MKKISLLIITSAMVLTLSACATKQKEKETVSSAKEEEVNKKEKQQEEKQEKEKQEKEKKEKEKKEKENQLAEILSTDNPQKYIDAYNQFTMQGNPMPPQQRGSSPAPETSGLSGQDYQVILWGIMDYYGNAYNEGLITEEQNQETKKQAVDKLAAGAYGDPSKVKEQVTITSDNVIDYLDAYVKDNSDLSLSYLEVKLAEDGMSQQVYFESTVVGSPARGYFIVTPAGKISRFSNGGEPLTPFENLG